MTISDIANSLYTTEPDTVFWHYTSLSGIKGIVDSKTIYATDARFLNDASELNHLRDLLTYEINQRLRNHPPSERMLLQLKEWISHRVGSGGILFIASFSANGNLLSQWRGYCPSGKGVCIAFDPHELVSASRDQQFTIGKCIYAWDQKTQILSSLLDEIEALAIRMGEVTDTGKRHPLNSYHDVFESIEDDLLRVACLFKDPAFREEEEWRIVSPVVSNYVEAEIEYREGISMLVPFIRFQLPKGDDEKVHLFQVMVGPTPNPDQSITSLSRFLSKYASRATLSVSTSEIPYRSW